MGERVPTDGANGMDRKLRKYRKNYRNIDEMSKNVDILERYQACKSCMSGLEIQ